MTQLLGKSKYHSISGQITTESLAPYARRHSSSFPVIGVLILALGSAGCAYSYKDDQGIYHTVGLVSMSVELSDEYPDSAGTTIEVSSIGLSGQRTPLMSSITIGYNREQITGLKNDVLLLDNGNLTGACEENTIDTKEK